MEDSPGISACAARVRRGLPEAVVLAVVGILLGWAVQEMRCPGCPWTQDWSADSVAARHLDGLQAITLEDAGARHRDNRALFLDARDPGSYAAGRLPGAMNVQPQDAEAWAEEIKALAEAGMEVIAYCDGVNCPLSAELARALEALGVPSVKVLVNGWSRWRDAGLPTERG